MRLAGVVLYTRRLSRILGTSSRGGYTILSPSLDAKVARITSYQSGSINSTANWRLAFFLAGHNSMQVHLVDDDQFEITNYRAQLLLGENFKPWLDKPKVEFLAERCSRWGWDVTKERTRITWGWKNPLGPHCVAFLGFDNMEARRVGVEAGFAWLVECGVGTDFSKPHVSWHSLPPDRRVAKELFVESAPSTAITSLDSDFLRRLDETPGGVGGSRLRTFKRPLLVWAHLLRRSRGWKCSIIRPVNCKRFLGGLCLEPIATLPKGHYFGVRLCATQPTGRTNNKMIVSPLIDGGRAGSQTRICSFGRYRVVQLRYTPA